MDDDREFKRAKVSNGSFAGKLSGWIAGTALTLGVIGVPLTHDYIAPGEQAVRQVKVPMGGLLAEEEGIQRTGGDNGNGVFYTGLVRNLPIVEDLIVSPREIQVHNLVENQSGPRVDGVTNGPKVRVQTSDGFYADIEASVIYRIEDPQKMIAGLGPGDLYLRNGIVAKSDPAIKRTLGKLEPEDMYVVSERKGAQEEATAELDQELEQYGIDIDHILIRGVGYHEKIQSRIEQTVEKDQRFETNTAQAALSAANARLEKIVAEGQAAVVDERARGDAYKTERDSQADRYEREKRAEGDELVRLAQAYKTQKVNDAYEGPGAELLVGRKMAQNFGNLQYILIEGNMNPLDLETTTEKITGGGN